MEPNSSGLQYFLFGKLLLSTIFMIFTFVEALCAQGNLTPFFNLLLKRYSSKPRLGPSFSEGGLGAPPSVDPTQVTRVKFGLLILVRVKDLTFSNSARHLS